MIIHFNKIHQNLLKEYREKELEFPDDNNITFCEDETSLKILLGYLLSSGRTKVFVFSDNQLSKDLEAI
jgi:hypothetical protein